MGWLNYLVLRWFLFRLVREEDADGNMVKMYLRWWPSWRWA